MFWLIRLTLRTAITLRLMALAFGAGMGMVYAMQLRSQHRTWGLLDGEAAVSFEGDELVPRPDIVETRGLAVEAPVDQVWPWLVQLGHGRGGWYSYPVLDRPWRPDGGSAGTSADRILPEQQQLAEGDLVPTHHGGGFVVRHIQPGAALVLFLDDDLLREQAAAAGEDAEAAPDEGELPPFAVSWTFRLEERPGERTYLIERLRLHLDGLSDRQRRAIPLLRYGLFALLRAQMLGIKHRAETAALREEA